MKSPGEKRFNYLVYAAVTTAVFALLSVSLLHKRPVESVTYTKMLMGTVVEVTVMDAGSSRPDEAAQAAFDEIKRLEKILSSYDPKSDVSRVSSSGPSMVKVSPEVIEVAEEALRVARLSDGAFDPTIGALKTVWGYSGELGRVPCKEEVKKYLPLVDYRKVVVDEEGSSIGLKERGMVLNLGGI
ncbi:MAG: FAD:protein FMN transferase, partial [Deltaproteobacteria bacterium]|nr:FAD:protein FMN transferase [Deltaproteobacteria bacterium]